MEISTRTKNGIKNQNDLVNSLLKQKGFDHQINKIEVIETHISWIILTGKYAYKIKKALNIDIYNGCSLKKRIHLCKEEVRLNKRLTPDQYIGVVKIIGPLWNPRITSNEIISSSDSDESVIEVAIKMKQFKGENLLSKLIEHETIRIEEMTALGNQMASFHLDETLDLNKIKFIQGNSLSSSIYKNFDTLKSILRKEIYQDFVSSHERWIRCQEKLLMHRLKQRVHHACYRDCHGDLHSENIFSDKDGHLRVFDSLEFNKTLRLIDPISEIAFLTTDLEARGKSIEANIFLNAWLAKSGDYLGLDLWRWYSSYRSLVRAKVMCLRLDQFDLKDTNSNEKISCENMISKYIAQAKIVENMRPKGLIIMNGLSGSGKSTLAKKLCIELNAVKISSDLERSRLTRISSPKDKRPEFIEITSGMPSFSNGKYGKEVTDFLYMDWIPKLVQASINSCYITIVDATFMTMIYRENMRNLANKNGVKFAIINCKCSESTAIKRIADRKSRGKIESEADYNVRINQKLNLENLNPQENSNTVYVNEDSCFQRILRDINNLIV